MIRGVRDGWLVRRNARGKLGVGQPQLKLLDLLGTKHADGLGDRSAVLRGEWVVHIGQQIVKLARVVLDLRPEEVAIVVAGEAEVGSFLSDVVRTKNDVPRQLALDAKSPALLIRRFRCVMAAERANGAITHIIQRS